MPWAKHRTPNCYPGYQLLWVCVYSVCLSCFGWKCLLNALFLFKAAVSKLGPGRPLTCRVKLKLDSTHLSERMQDNSLFSWFGWVKLEQELTYAQRPYRSRIGLCFWRVYSTQWELWMNKECIGGIEVHFYIICVTYYMDKESWERKWKWKCPSLFPLTVIRSEEPFTVWAPIRGLFFFQKTLRRWT